MQFKGAKGRITHRTAGLVAVHRPQQVTKQFTDQHRHRIGTVRVDRQFSRVMLWRQELSGHAVVLRRSRISFGGSGRELLRLQASGWVGQPPAGSAKSTGERKSKVCITRAPGCRGYPLPIGGFIEKKRSISRGAAAAAAERISLVSRHPLAEVSCSRL